MGSLLKQAERCVYADTLEPDSGNADGGKYKLDFSVPSLCDGFFFFINHR